MRARLSARIYSSLIVWLTDSVAKTSATADILKKDVVESRFEEILFVFCLHKFGCLLPMRIVRAPKTQQPCGD